MKLAYITSMKKGLPSFVYREIEALLKKGIHVTIFATKFGEGVYMVPEGGGLYRLNVYLILFSFFSLLISRPIQTVRLLANSIKYKTTGHFLIACQFSRKMLREDIDTIHCMEGLHSLWIGYYCHGFMDVNLFVTVHADTLYVNPNDVITKEALERCKAIVTVSEFNRKKIHEKFGIPLEKIRVIRMSIDTESFKPRDQKTIMIVGQYAERKGHETLFRAVKALNSDNVKLWIVGSGSWGNDYVDVRKLAKDLNIYGECIFISNISESVLYILYQNCDIFCLPSRTGANGNSEGIPTSLMEAMSCGKPVVSTYHTGIPELVDEYLVEEGDWKELSSVLEKLLKNGSECIRQGEKNRQKIQREYSTSNYEQFIELLTIK